MRIIDSSARLTCEGGVLRPDDLLREMDAWEVSHAVIAPSDEFFAVYNEEGNRQIATIAGQHADRFSGLAVANPWYGERAVEMLRAAFDDGLVGLYLHPPRQGFRLTEEIVDPIIRVCAEHGKPVYCHTGTPICAEPFQLAELARRHPDAAFIAGHAAWSDFGAYDLIPAARQAPNLHVETSCTAPDFVARLVKEIGADRLLFGSAYPRSRYRFEVNKINRLRFDEVVMSKLMWENAVRMWGIGEP